MDTDRLTRGVSGGDGGMRDDPDFESSMPHAIHGCSTPSIGDAVTPAELADRLRNGSLVCALDALPRRVLASSDGAGVGAISALLSRADDGGELLCTVLHLPLVKKEPSWLLRNCRPVLLELGGKRAEATVQFHRLM